MAKPKGQGQNVGGLTPARKTIAAAKPLLSEVLVVDSESDSDRSKQESDSSSTSDDEQPSEPEIGSASKPSMSANSNGIAAGAESETSSSDPSSSSEDEDEAPAEKPAVAIVSESKGVKRPRYEPPTGFVKRKSTGHQTDLDKSILQSKELWHITCPKDLPLESLETASFNSVLEENVLVSHGGVEYDFTEGDTTVADNAEKPNVTVLLVEPNSHRYKAISVPLSRTLHIQQKLPLPDMTNHLPVTAAIPASEARREIKPQPKALRMRYRPPGFGAGRTGRIGSDSSGGESDDEMEDAAGPLYSKPGPKPTFAGHSQPSTSSKSKEGRKEERKKKGQKRQHTAEDRTAVVAAESEKHNSAARSRATAASSKKEPLANGHISESDENLNNGDEASAKSEQKLTREEREAKRQRKEERRQKRLQKEERRRIKEAKASGKVIAA